MYIIAQTFCFVNHSERKGCSSDWANIMSEPASAVRCDQSDALPEAQKLTSVLVLCFETTIRGDLVSTSRAWGLCFAPAPKVNYKSERKVIILQKPFESNHNSSCAKRSLSDGGEHIRESWCFSGTIFVANDTPGGAPAMANMAYKEVYATNRV